jgi:hypothetical protein
MEAMETVRIDREEEPLEELELAPDEDALEFLDKVMRDTRQPIQRRMLDRAISRSQVKLLDRQIDHQPAPAPPSPPSPPSPTRRFTPFPDRRFRR